MYVGCGSLFLDSFNVLNYFTTLGSLGADTEEEREDQLAKDADVIGIIEVCVCVCVKKRSILVTISRCSYSALQWMLAVVVPFVAMLRRVLDTTMSPLVVAEGGRRGGGQGGILAPGPQGLWKTLKAAPPPNGVFSQLLTTTADIRCRGHKRSTPDDILCWTSKKIPPPPPRPPAACAHGGISRTLKSWVSL